MDTRAALPAPPVRRPSGLATFAKVVVLTLAAIGVAGFSTAVVGAVVVVHEGMIRVSVDEKTPGGDHVHFFFPAAIVNLGLTVAPGFIPEDAWGEDREEIARFRPALVALAREIEKCPEGDLIEVRDRDETVHIGLRDGAFAIDVESPQESVHLAVPVSVFKSAAGILPAS
ncbi:MAG: hypothetical protein U0166_22205 [Acidobacteriota bacterium]